MFRLWGKEFKDNHMLRDTVICDETDETRTHKIDEFKRHDKTRFYQDNFVDSIDFDYLEIHIIEE